jgi:hypothetical protein
VDEQGVDPGPAAQVPDDLPRGGAGVAHGMADAEGELDRGPRQALQLFGAVQGRGDAEPVGADPAVGLPDDGARVPVGEVRLIPA